MSADRIATLNSQLTVAREKLARLTAQRDAIIKRDANRDWTETDPAIGSGIRRKPNPKADARRFNGYDRDAQVFKDYDDAEKRVSILSSTLTHAIAERDRVRFTAVDLAGARHVRDQFGWHRVARVNVKSVSVLTEYSWTDRIAIEDILQFAPAVTESVAS